MTTKRGFKRESTSNGGLMTPNPSSNGRSTVTPTPKRDESIDLTSINTFEDPSLTRNESYSLPSEAQYDGEHSRPNSDSVSFAQSNYDMSSEKLASGEGLERVGRDVNKLIGLIDKLRVIGLQGIDGALPELVLVGDQSAGKSSLMGAIAEINLPKKAAMCTRCPFNIKTGDAPAWKCSVSLQEDYRYNPSARRKPFPKWEQGAGMTSRLFKEIDKKGDLEEVLTWAQIAILNPSTHNLNMYVPGQSEFLGNESIEVQYSPNVIAVEIRGPGLPALSFYDLPGLLQDAGSKDLQFLVEVFDDLTRKYVRHESAIIICTLSMANDPGLSKTKRLIGDLKADHKCIGVLTMPDRMQGEASKQADYDAIFRGSSFKLPRGYYVTKQPGPDCPLDKTSNNYHALARQEEENFFDTSRHWGSDGAWSEFRNRCGTGVIQQYLSKEFARQILKSLPDLRDTINLQMRDVDEKLAQLPEIPADKVQYIVRQRLMSFSMEVQRILDGSSDSNRFHSNWTKLCSQFLKAVEIMRPGCVCSHPSDKIQVVIQIDESDTESVTSRPSQTFRRQRQGDDLESPSKRPRLNDSPIPFNTPVQSRVKTENGMDAPNKYRSPAAQKLEADEIGPFKQKYLDSGYGFMSVGDIQKSIEQYSRAGFPDFVSHKVKEEYALQALHYWNGPLQTFIDHTFLMLRLQVLSTLESVMAQQLHTDLYRQSRVHVEEFMSALEQDQRAVTTEFYDIEKRGLFTINLEAFNRHRAEASTVLKQTRRNHRVEFYTQAHFRNKANDPERAQAEREKFKKSVTNDLLSVDTFEREIEVASYIRGYYTTARLRFTDSVCANMHTRYFQMVSQKIQSLLEDKFNLNHGDSEATCQRLLEGSAEISEKRIYLRNRRKQLQEFSRTLEELWNEAFADDVHGDLNDNTSNSTVEGDDTQNSRASTARV